MNDTEPIPSVSSLSVRDMAFIALFAAVISVSSWITVPAVVPFTMQTFGVFLSVLVLGGKRGTLSVLVYILLGAIGLPVFSGFTGGPGKLLSTTGGYIVGFLLAALVMWGLESLPFRGLPASVLSMLAGLLVCYLFGTLWFMKVYTGSSGPVSLITVLGWCVFPFFLPDLGKILLAAFLAPRIRALTGASR